MHTQHITLSGGDVAYLQKGQGPPLLLLHGWAGSSRYWHDTLEYLADSRTVYALDLPGYGDSPPWNEIPGIQKMAALVIEFANALGLDRFDLNGHSLSTSIAVYTAITVPHRIRRLVLTCASTYRNDIERRIANQVHQLLGLWISLRRPWMGHIRFFYRAATRRFFYRIPSDDLLRKSFDDFLRMDHYTAIMHANDVANIDYHAALRQVSVPTLLISARQDMIMRTAGSPVLAQLIPNCRLTWIERCGHLPMIERPDVYHRVLREFLLSDS
jgi:pimeloyl-ACP methyl ester carboxylesterase